MAVVKFFHILTVVSLAILHASFDARPVNALSVERSHLGRDLGHAHAEIAKKRGDPAKKCRPRPSSASSSPVAPTPNPGGAPAAIKSEPPAQTTSSSKPASTNAPPSSVNSKVMLAWSNMEQPSLPHFAGSSKRLVYNWSLKKYSDFNIDSLGDFEFVPTAQHKSDFDGLSKILTPGYAKYAKFINEPDISSQGDTSPEEAVQLWRQFFEPLVGSGYSLIGPSVTGGGYTWLQTFLNQCSGCHIYALDLHYYGLTTDDFITTVNKFHSLRTSVPMWITEVGCHDYSGGNKWCTQGIFDSMFDGVMNYVESTSWIEQVAWFGLFTSGEMPMGLEAVNSMITCSGDNKQCTPNGLGQKYLAFH